MANLHRGEVDLNVAGRVLPMRLTLGALAELESAFAVDSLPSLGERFCAGRLSARDLIRIIGAGLRGAGGHFSDAEVEAFDFDGGLNGAIRAAIGLLEATFVDQDRPVPPPPPPA